MKMKRQVAHFFVDNGRMAKHYLDLEDGCTLIPSRDGR